MQLQFQPPLNRTGSIFQKPSWRFEALMTPYTYGFGDYRSKKKSKASFLSRFINKDKLPYEDLLKPIPETVLKYKKLLPDNLGLQLLKVWKNSTPKQPRFNFGSTTKLSLNSWNLTKTRKLRDEWLKRLVLHALGDQYDVYIEIAVDFFKNKVNSEVKQFIGYCFFAGLSDAQLTVRFRLQSVKVAEALRHLFFDFSALPTDPVAKWASLRQWAKLGYISEEEFGFYKRIFDMGEVGMKAQVAFSHLSQEEQKKIENFLGMTVVSNTFNVNFGVRSIKDAISYNRMLNEASQAHMQAALLKHKSAEMELLNLNIAKARKELNVEASNEQPEDIELFEDLAKELSKRDATPKYIDFNELKAEK